MAREVNEQEYRLIDRVTAGFNTIAAGLGKLKTGMTELNQTAELASKGLGLVVGAARGLGDQVKGAADLESALASLRAVTAGSAEDMAKLEAAAVNASKRTSFSALEAAQGLTELARAGLDATEAIDVLNPALSLAQGNGIAVSQSAELLTTTIKQFGQEMDQAARFADVLQATADGTSTSVEQIGNAMSYAAPLARQLGLSVEETSAIIGALADQGFRGERAGTALRNVFSTLLDPSSKFGEALRDLGIQSTDFSTVIQQLAANGDGAKRALLALDAEARPAILSLVQGGGAAVADLTAKLKDAGGSAERTAKIMGETFNGALSRFTNSFENARNALATPILQPLADGLQQLADRLNAAAADGSLERVGQKFADFVSNAVPQIIQLIEQFDFTQATANVIAFVDRATIAFNELIKLTTVVGGAIGTVYDVVKAGAATVVESFAGVANDVTELAVQLGVPAENLAQLFDDVAKGARGLSDEALLSLQHRFGLTAEQATRLGREVNATAIAARTARADLKALADALPANDVGAIAARWKEVGQAIEQIPEPAKIAVDSMLQVKVSAEEAAIGLERLRISTLAQAQSTLAQAGLENTATFRALTVEIGKAEERIRALTEAQQKAKASTDAQTESTQQATGALREYASASSQAERSSSQLADRNSQVRQSFGNIGAAASSVAVDMGNLSEEYIRQSLAAAGASKSIGGYIDTLNRAMNAGIEQQRELQNRLDQQNKLIRSLDEESQALDRLSQQYPALSRGALKELYDAEKRLTELRERKNRVTREGIDIEQQAANAANAAAGGLGNGPRPTGAQTNGGGTQQPVQSGGITQIFQIQGAWSQDNVNELAALLERRARLAR